MEKEEKEIWSRNFLFTCLSSFFMFINFYMLAATMPLYVKENMGGSNQQMGLVITLYVLANVSFRPFSGIWTDRFGNKRMTVLCMALFFICTVAYLGAASVGLLLAIRFVHGIGFSLGSTAAAAMAIDFIPGKRRGEGIGYYGMFMSLAMVVGPSLGLFLSGHFPYKYLLLICAGLTSLSVLFALGVKKQALASVRPAAVTGFSLRSFLEKKAMPIGFAALLLAFSYTSLISFMPVYTKAIGLPQAAMYFFMIFAIAIILSRPFVGKLFDRKGEHVLVYPGLLLFISGMLVLSMAASLAQVIASAVLMGLGYGALFPSFQTLAVQLAPAHRLGAATATFFLLFDMGYGLGSYFLALVASLIGYRGMYACAAGNLLLALAVYYFFHHRLKSRRQHKPATLQAA